MRTVCELTGLEARHQAWGRHHSPAATGQCGKQVERAKCLSCGGIYRQQSWTMASVIRESSSEPQAPGSPIARAPQSPAQLGLFPHHFLCGILKNIFSSAGNKFLEFPFHFRSQEIITGSMLTAHKSAVISSRDLSTPYA